MTLYLPTGSIKLSVDCIRCRNANPVSTNPLVDVLTTASSGPVCVARSGISCGADIFSGKINNYVISTFLYVVYERFEEKC